MLWKIFLGIAAASTAACIYLFWRNGELRADLAHSELLVAACDARTKSILRKKESDDEIDRIPDDGLRNAPGRWLLPDADPAD